MKINGMEVVRDNSGNLFQLNGQGRKAIEIIIAEQNDTKQKGELSNAKDCAKD